LFIIYKQRKWLLAFSFLAVYFIIIILTSLSSLGTISLLDTTAMFFAFFMLIEPMTSATRKNYMAMQGILVAIFATAFKILPVDDLFLGALLAGNIFVAFVNNSPRKIYNPSNKAQPEA
jgi:Na+-translocating ferredoxin:NAD+ oxidoreductase RnfD subunit